jgi:outer membrane protein assembly factor BamB
MCRGDQRGGARVFARRAFSRRRGLMMRHYVLGVLFSTACLVSCAATAADAPRFLSNREPAPGDLSVPPSTWSATENVLWKVDLPGIAWSTPIVLGDRVFVTSCISKGEVAEPRKGLYLEDLDANKYPKPTTPHVWKVICLDLASGEVKWEQTAHEGVPPKPHHIKNSLASETPTTDGERIYALFGNIGLYCYDLDGKLLWSQRFEPRETRYGWGTSISPVVYKGRVYVANDNDEESYLLAFDAKTGSELWRVPRDEQTNYSTPFVWENENRTELVISGINWARSYDLNGQLLWQLKGRSILAIPTPFARFGNLYLTSGHVAWGENPMYAIRPGAEGDISPSDDPSKPLSEYLAWYQPKAGPYHPTPLIIGDQIYVLYDRGFMASYDAKTGREVYPRKRIPNGRAFTSSPWTYDDKLFCINEDGVTFVIKPGPEFEILYTNTLAEDDMCMASPVVVGDKLLIRTSARLYCLQDKSAK